MYCITPIPAVLCFAMGSSSSRIFSERWSGAVLVSPCGPPPQHHSDWLRGPALCMGSESAQFLVAASPHRLLHRSNKLPRPHGEEPVGDKSYGYTAGGNTCRRRLSHLPSISTTKSHRRPMGAVTEIAMDGAEQSRRWMTVN